MLMLIWEKIPLWIPMMLYVIDEIDSEGFSTRKAYCEWWKILGILINYGVPPTDALRTANEYVATKADVLKPIYIE